MRKPQDTPTAVSPNAPDETQHEIEEKNSREAQHEHGNHFADESETPEPVDTPPQAGDHDAIDENGEEDQEESDRAKERPALKRDDWKSNPLVVYAVVGQKLASMQLSRPPMPTIAVGATTVHSERRDDGDGPYVFVEVQRDRAPHDFAVATAAANDRDVSDLETRHKSILDQIQRLDDQIGELAHRIKDPVERLNAAHAQHGLPGDDYEPEQVPDPEQNEGFKAAKAQNERARAEYVAKADDLEKRIKEAKADSKSAKKAIPPDPKPTRFRIPLGEIELADTDL